MRVVPGRAARGRHAAGRAGASDSAAATRCARAGDRGRDARRAAIAWALLVPGYTPTIPELEAATTPQVTLALYEPHDVNIAVDTPSPLADAEIRVVLTGAIELDGFANQRELRWRTNLDAGANQLTLPIIATGTGGGQLLVEVHHGQKRRTFVVDVRA